MRKSSSKTFQTVHNRIPLNLISVIECWQFMKYALCKLVFWPFCLALCCIFGFPKGALSKLRLINEVIAISSICLPSCCCKLLRLLKITQRFNQKKRPRNNIGSYVLIELLTAGPKNIFDKNHVGFCSPHLYASFGTFCVQIGTYFEVQYVFEVCMFENRQIAAIEAKCRQFRNSSECF